MAVLDHDNAFQSWVMTEKEKAQGSILTVSQKQCIQNQIAFLANERIMLAYDTNNQLAFIQRDAELKGQILCLKWLITQSGEYEKVLSTPESHLHINS